MANGTVALELNSVQIEALLEKLPMEEKIRLARKLEQQTWGKRLEQVFKKIDARRRKSILSNKEIAREIEIVRRQIYGPRGN